MVIENHGEILSWTFAAIPAIQALIMNQRLKLTEGILKFFFKYFVSS